MKNKAPAQLDREIVEALTRSGSSNSFAGAVRRKSPHMLAMEGVTKIWRYSSNEGWRMVKTNVRDSLVEKILKICRSENPHVLFSASPTRPGGDLDEWVVVLDGLHSAGNATYLGDYDPRVRRSGRHRPYVQKLEDASRYTTQKVAWYALQGGKFRSRYPTSHLLQLTAAMPSGYVEHPPNWGFLR